MRLRAFTPVGGASEYLRGREERGQGGLACPNSKWGELYRARQKHLERDKPSSVLFGLKFDEEVAYVGPVLSACRARPSNMKIRLAVMNSRGHQASKGQSDVLRFSDSSREHTGRLCCIVSVSVIVCGVVG